MDRYRSASSDTPSPRSSDGRWPCSGRRDEWFVENSKQNPAETAYVQQQCRDHCPLAQQMVCAGEALESNAAYGVWAGVSLPGAQYRNRGALEQARARLRKIAGLDRCATCWQWFQSHDQTHVCPDCAAPDQPPPPAGARHHRTPVVEPERDRCDISELAAGAAITPELRLYWDLRRRSRTHRDLLLDGTGQPDWLLIRPDKTVEGCYAWPTAARTFARTPERFARMLTEGWTIRRATADDQHWNHPVAQRPTSRLDLIPA
jgi:hypothetical protein